ncbi:MAG: MFS transporter [Ardenticatenaceae bacterium]|nr:MFS transporter [Ardenticatenaceae bacterium]
MISAKFNLEPWQKTLYIVFFSQLVSVVGFASIFPFLPLYVQSLEIRSNLSVELLAGLVYSTQAFTMMIASPIWGAVADRYGRKPMILRAMLGGSVTMGLMGFAGSAEMVVFLRAVQGTVTGTISAANALIAAEVPRRKMGFAMGLMQVALWGGVALGPLLGGVLADAFGYRLSFVLTASLLLIAAALIQFGVTENIKPEERESHKNRSLWQDWQHILAAPGVKIAYTVRFVAGLAQVLIVPIAPLFILSLLPDGAPINFYTGLVIGVGGLASTVTSVMFGRMGDRIGHRKILLVSALIGVIAYAPQGFVTAAWQLLILQAISGAALGGVVTAVAALLAHFTVQGEEGSVYGLDNALVAGSRVISPLLGAFLATAISMRATLSITAVFFAVVFLISWLALPSNVVKTSRIPTPAD